MDNYNLIVRAATRKDIPSIVNVANSSIRPGEDIGFGGTGITISETEVKWEDPNILKGHMVYVAEINRQIVGIVQIEDKGRELELVDIDVLLTLQGKGVGTRIVKFVEEKARRMDKKAVTLGTSRNAQGVPWKSLPWWQHLGYRITHEEENEWTRSIGLGAREIRMRKDLG
jgi:GNAT superfamily N-acetyltransferase